ncbi:MAG: PrgI family protein [Candidatus Nealsonbacteria bacterium]|nr:PrgI family protein [Candidatus Nealsonbacteria bacterium]
MDQFTVPQFIEHKPKIVGPLTFQQFIYVGAGGVICFFLYFTVPFFFFILGTIIILSIAALLAFGQSGGRPLPLVFKNFIAFTLQPKIYLWKKKVGPPPKLVQAEKPKPAEVKETPVPTMIGKSHLKDLSSQIR